MDTRIPPPLVALALAVCGWALGRSGVAPQIVFWGQAELAIILLAGGLSCMISGVLAFRIAGTTVNPLRPELASQLVVSGIYRRTRNPMYLGLLGVLAAWAVCLGQPLALLMLPVWVWYIGRFQIQPEEAALHRLFGSSYTAYCGKVRRWV